MLFGALLPSCCKSEVTDVLAGHEFIDADSWKALGVLAQTKGIAGVLADPSVDRIQGVMGAKEFLRAHPRLPTIGFFSLSAPNLHLALVLAREGLCEAYTYPLAARQGLLKRLVDTLASPGSVARFLELIEPSFGRLPPPMGATVRDLFHRPHRYSSAADLAAECRSSIRQLYRRLEVANLGSPKKLLVAAKVLRGLDYLLERKLSVQDVSDRLGYTDTSGFAKHTIQVFACTPSMLRPQGYRDDMVVEVVDWLFKPSKIAQRTRQSDLH